jgi:hypothetical protein
VALKFLSPFLFIGYMHFGERQLTRALRSRPESVVYEKEDIEFLTNRCKQYHIFDYSIYLPVDLHVLSVFRNSDPISWEIMLGRCTAKEFNVVANLTDRSLVAMAHPGYREKYGLRNPYEVEGKISRPGWSPLWMGLRLVHSANDTAHSFEQVSAPGWKGFVIAPIPDSGRRGYVRCSAYDSTGHRSAEIGLFLIGKDMTVDRVKSMLATLEFQASDGKAQEFFDQGMVSFTSRSFGQASVNFANALYVDRDNPEYAYYLALSLWEVECEPWGWSRLYSARSLLEYSLKLDSTSAPARQLLDRVEREMQLLEEEKDE